MVDGFITQISGGSTFSEALAQYPRIFDKHYVQMVATGEASGQLEERHGRTGQASGMAAGNRSQVKQSSTYPLIMIRIASRRGSSFDDLYPAKFVKLLLQFNMALPVPTRIVIAVSNAFFKLLVSPACCCRPFPMPYTWIV